MINKGNNPLSKIEIVSGLNLFSYAPGSLAYNSGNRTQKYNPKVYIGTLQSTSKEWNYDSQNTSKPPANQWPQNFGQTTQKGEANKKRKYTFNSRCVLVLLSHIMRSNSCTFFVSFCFSIKSSCFKSHNCHKYYSDSSYYK